MSKGCPATRCCSTRSLLGPPRPPHSSSAWHPSASWASLPMSTTTGTKQTERGVTVCLALCQGLAGINASNLHHDITSFCKCRKCGTEGKLLVQGHTGGGGRAGLGTQAAWLQSLPVTLLSTGWGEGPEEWNMVHGWQCPTPPLQSLPGEERLACDLSAPSSPENISPWAE